VLAELGLGDGCTVRFTTAVQEKPAELSEIAHVMENQEDDVPF
jgi:hypothetical protein